MITWIGWIQSPVQKDNHLNITGDICVTPNQNTQTPVRPAALNVWDILYLKITSQKLLIISTVTIFRMLKASCNKLVRWCKIILFRFATFTELFMNNFRNERHSAVSVMPPLKYNGVQTAHIICVLKYTMENVSTDFLSLFRATRVRNL
jgi:hypothetical protein